MDSGIFGLMRLSSYEMQGSSGDEMDSPQELQNNAEVPKELEVIPLSMQEHYLDRIKVRSTEQLLSEIAKMQGPPQELEIKDGRVFTHKFLHRGTKYGPYTVKYTDQPVDRQFAWEAIERQMDEEQRGGLTEFGDKLSDTIYSLIAPGQEEKLKRCLQKTKKKTK
ncbi:Transcription factor hamlet [Pseudolycoriella hygida]|uniref:Transcription factor hamlet n=1 Tax=Pseudolycoriella hygida TaxID=35572 RepID=A0A9Q0S7W9_9DIPT|nr:Transcription factor hamlet [Pseudolycoriella hygida]